MIISVKIYEELYVQFQCKACMIPLHLRFVSWQNPKLSFPSCMKNNILETEYLLLEELQARQFYKAKRRSPFSAHIILYALCLRLHHCKLTSHYL